MARQIDNRMGNDQRVGNTTEEAQVTPPQTGFEKSETVGEGTALKQEAVAEVLTNKGAVGGRVSSPSRSGLLTLSYGGNAGTILGSAAGTPTAAGQDRAATRFGKKVDEITKKIDYVASEQVLQRYRQPKNIAEAGNERQGYNGTPMNESARTQKTSGSHPGELLFQRSVDFISRDELFYINGQYVKEDGVDLMDYPTETYDPKTKNYIQFQVRRGSWMPREIEVKIKKDAQGNVFVSSFTPIVSDVTPTGVTPGVINAASQAAILDMNSAELDRQNIDAKAGRESSETWSPLGRAIKDPSSTMAYLRDLEAEMGAFEYASYRFGTKALAYQLNKAAKDGQADTRAMREMFMLNLCTAHTSDVFEDNNSLTNVFDYRAARAGSAATMIAIDDSTAKYGHRSDFLVQPKSLKSKVVTAKNNIEFLRCKKEFMKCVDAFDAFSTIDGVYDPTSPVLITDGVCYVTSADWSTQFRFTRSLASDTRNYPSKAYAYAYMNRNTQYVIRMGNPLLAGIAWWIEQHATKLHRVLNPSNASDPDYKDEVTWHIPVRSNTMSFSLWDFLVMAATPAILYERSHCMKDILDFEGNFEYPFSQLAPIKDYLDSRANYTFTDVNTPLVAGRLSRAAKVTWVAPELFSHDAQRTTANPDVDYIDHPWYMSAADYDITDNDANQKADVLGHMTYPVVRAGLHLAGLDMFYDMTEREVRLSLDRLVVSPLMAATNQTMKVMVYKLAQNADGQISVEKPAKLFTAASAIKSSVRELGWHAVLPAGVASPNCSAYIGPVDYSDLKATTDTLDYMDKSSGGIGLDALLTPSYKVYCYTAVADTPSDILDNAAVLVDRGQAFVQRWYRVQSMDPAKYATGVGLPSGIVVAPRHYFANSTIPTYSPYTSGHLQHSSAGFPTGEAKITDLENPIGDLARGLWTVVQKLPFLFNPFDFAVQTAENTGHSLIDKYSLPYVFGLAGFLDSDFEEDVDYRVYNGQERGWQYTEDPFVADSPIFN